MALERRPLSGEQAAQNKRHSQEQGFVLVGMLSLVPLLCLVFVCLAASYYVIKRKALAQAHCVQEAARMQNELKDSLDRLLKLNKQATLLRQKRFAADRAWEAAVSSANPYAIAAAKAVRIVVILEQLALRTKQESILLEAERQRQRGHRELKSRVARMRVRALTSHRMYWRALAVEAEPATSLTPDYKPVPMFSRFQQHRFGFEVDLQPPFRLGFEVPGLKQRTECSVTLTGRETAWRLKIVSADNAASKLSWF